MQENESKLMNLSLKSSDDAGSSTKPQLDKQEITNSGKKRNYRFDKVSSPVGDYIRGLSPTVKKSKIHTFLPLSHSSPIGLESATVDPTKEYSSPQPRLSASHRTSERKWSSSKKRTNSARKSMRGSSNKKRTPASIARGPTYVHHFEDVTNENVMTENSSPFQSKSVIRSCYHNFAFEAIRS